MLYFLNKISSYIVEAVRGFCFFRFEALKRQTHHTNMTKMDIHSHSLNYLSSNEFVAFYFFQRHFQKVFVLSLINFNNELVQHKSIKISKALTTNKKAQLLFRLLKKFQLFK